MLRSLTCFATLLAACGGGAAHTGVDPDLTLGQLDARELTEVCRAAVYQDYGLDSDGAHRWVCYATAILLHHEFPLVFNCVDSVTSCLAEPPGAGGEEDACDFSAGVPALGTCADVRVGDIERCLDAIDARARDLVDTVSCATSPELVLGLPPACTDVAARCPDLFGK